MGITDSDALGDQLLEVPGEVALAWEASLVNQGHAVSRFVKIRGCRRAERRAQVDPILRPCEAGRRQPPCGLLLHQGVDVVAAPLQRVDGLFCATNPGLSQVLKYEIGVLRVVANHAEGSAIARMSYFKT